MPFCPECKYEYVQHVSICPDCDVQLVPALPHESSPDQFEVVYIAKNAMEANIIKGALNVIGMPVIAMPVHDPSSGFRWMMASPGLVGDVVKIGIHVPASRADEARRFIEETYHGEVCPDEILSVEDASHSDSPDADLTPEEECEFSPEDFEESEEEDDSGWLRPRGSSQ